MKGSQGYRRRTRNLKTKLRDRGKTKIRKYLQSFKENDVVSIVIDPSYQSIPYPLFHGKTGRVIGRRGRACFVEIKDGDKTKKVVVAPEHLTKIEASR
jgi:large subunit ribosomal protein L21e